MDLDTEGDLPHEGPILGFVALMRLRHVRFRVFPLFLPTDSPAFGISSPFVLLFSQHLYSHMHLPTLFFACYCSLVLKMLYLY